MRRLIQFTQGCLMMRYVNADSDHTKLSVGGNMMMLIQYKVEYLLWNDHDVYARLFVG
ncbi:Hypothetical predicted protein [Mytilus galloprovincialis]|uniref:Uncharacterized protein n=1 Tax=Mytilus galloprovincialis TaxID=29158 RepID=A0A8B6FDL1_MYTGA|nr:Hypothetical predicted protein [Mytilus galloprovincialis]